MAEKKHKAHLLYVEDDEALSFVTKDNLELAGYKITYAADGQEALKLFKKGNYDLAILDVMLPFVDGFEVAEKIRAKNVLIPIIFLTAKSLKEDKLHGLRIGGDDYLTKPFNMEELLLKIEIFLRRSLSPVLHSDGEIIQLKSYTFDYNNLLVRHGEEESSLTQKEADLLMFFSKHQNKLVKRSDILLALWGEDDYFLGRSMDVFITRLRKYLKKDEGIKIENVRGVGFRFLVNED